ncbi:dicarboxylate/amino acid:cation symporter [Gammaproteobacteria bacterium]|jgi:Na+/H+-dicarboxylate symporter|nr:dicarboxylate/amino acid:cation symporter [Gammaproteobacteria bacterium]
MSFNENKLIIAILFGAAAGIICGWLFGAAMNSVVWIGELFLDTLKMMIIPLIVAAVISGVTSLGDIRKLGKVGGATLLYYTSTTACAVLIGLFVVNLIQPGIGVEQLSQNVPEAVATKTETGFIDIIKSLITPNIISAAANTKLLPVIVFCLLFAAALTTIGEKNITIIRFFDGLNEVMMKLVMWVMVFAPIGIFALIAGKIGEAGGGIAIKNELLAVGSYCFTVILGLTLHFILLFIILVLFSNRGRKYFLKLLRALFTAFGTASSSATLPLTMKCAIEAGVDKRSVKFVLPIGATINMDGTALYESVAVMYIAQAYGIPMGLGEQAIIFVTATLAAIGAAGIPQAGLVTMLIVLNAVNLPVEGIGMILAVDWFLDRFRTTVNVWGDSVGAALIEPYLPKVDS